MKIVKETYLGTNLHLEVTDNGVITHSVTYDLEDETSVEAYFSAVPDHIGGRPKRYGNS